MSDGTTAPLVIAASGGDEAAWNSLVAQYSGLVWSVARSFRLSDADAVDVSQTVWLKLAERIDTLRDPERVGVWLTTATRNECLYLLRKHKREAISDPVDWLRRPPGPAQDGEVDMELLRREQRQILLRGISALGDACQSLIRVLMSDPEPTYEEISSSLDMPIGSIGPTRRRCLTRLKAIIEERTGGDRP
ncbi:MAG: sigma-70 family RNA polymerase sigma factor [Actinomycetia bacterium]|nr:sigma-70 family RNA polymerase sigma factor [Actinomycetes bacterium]